jgi:hypothetical protein
MVKLDASSWNTIASVILAPFDSDRLLVGQSSPLDSVRQIFSVDPFGHDETASAVLADVIDRHDVRMAEPGDLLRFEPALVDFLGADRTIDLRYLDGDGAVQPCVEPLVDSPESADADQGIEAISICQGPGQVRFRQFRAGLSGTPGACVFERLIEPLDPAQLLDLPTELVQPVRAIPAQLLRRRRQTLGFGLLPAKVG